MGNSPGEELTESQLSRIRLGAGAESPRPDWHYHARVSALPGRRIRYSPLFSRDKICTQKANKRVARFGERRDLLYQLSGGKL